MILKKIEEFDSKMVVIDRLEQKINNCQLQSSESEEKVKKHLNEFSQDLKLKASMEECENLRKKVDQSESQCNAFQKEATAKESYDKRMNLLIHGLKEKSAWETKNETKSIFEEFFKAGLDLDASAVSLVDIHRLPQRPVTKNGKRIDRPIVIKVATVMDKARITGSLRKLKMFNEGRKKDDPNTLYVFVTDHLPKRFELQKKKLIPQRGQKKSAENSLENYHSMLANADII